jgi:hypothetical protein
MNRPKKDFIPTSIISDLNIDSISLGSNGDRHNNNSNGARFHNLDRSKATSSYNLASYKSSHHQNNHSNSNFSRASKQYGSQSNISASMSGSQSVNNFNINSPTTSVATDRWEQAWEDNNNLYRPPSYHPQQQQTREHSLDKSNKTFKHSHTTYDFNRSNSINQGQATSNRSMNHYVDDPFDDPWSGILRSNYSSILATVSKANSTSHAILICSRRHHAGLMVMDSAAQ